MELQTVKLKDENIIPSGAANDGSSNHRSGIAKVLWRRLKTDVPRSKVIVGGLDAYKD